MSQVLFKKAIQAINEQGILLTFPINNRKEPGSLWSALFPRSEMRWEWSEFADDRVGQLWRIREELSRSSQVVYSKWYQGRATFFSKEAFAHLLASQNAVQQRGQLNYPEGRLIIEALEIDSPLSTRQLKEVAELKGKSFEALYNRVMKELWWSGLIVGFGEIEDSSFPSLAVGATSALFEEIWAQGQEFTTARSKIWLEKKLGPQNLFFKALEKGQKLSHIKKALRNS